MWLERAEFGNKEVFNWKILNKKNQKSCIWKELEITCYKKAKV